MIRTLIIIAALLGTLMAGMYFAPELATNKGYVLIAIYDRTIETTVIGALVIALAFYVALLALEWVLRKLFSSARGVRNWFGSRKAKKAMRDTEAGMLALVEGNYRHAEKLTSKSAQSSTAPLLNYLAAAEAAQAQGNSDKRDEYLRLASEDSKGDQAELAVAITTARLQMDKKEYEQALATLQKQHERHPRHTLLLTMLRQVHTELSDWEGLIKLLPALQKTELIDEKEKERLTQESYLKLFEQKLESQGEKALLKFWDEQPRKTKKDNRLLAGLCRSLIDAGHHESAYTLLADRLTRSADAGLVSLCGELELSDYHPLKNQLERLLKQADKDSLHRTALETSLGKLLIKEERWDDAKTHLSAALDRNPSTQLFGMLADTFEQLGDPVKANEMYRKGLHSALREA